MLQILDTGPALAQKNMDMDWQLLESLDPSGHPILHLYEWEGLSATYGYFLEPAKQINLEQANLRGVHFARRPTGGGIVFHIWDFAFSFLMPSSDPKFSLNTLENYRFVNEIVLKSVSELFVLRDPVLIRDHFLTPPDCVNFCMARPTEYDVVYKGRKVAGAAQRRRKQGYLHQGTISLALPEIELLQALLLCKSEVLTAMYNYTFAPLGNGPSCDLLQQTKEQLKTILIRHLKNSFPERELQVRHEAPIN